MSQAAAGLGLVGEVDKRVADIAERQHGAFARRQVLAAGGDDYLIKRRRAAGRWVAPAPGVYALAGWPKSWHRELWTAHLHLGPQSVGSHETAAALHGLHTFTFSALAFSVDHGDHHRRLPRLRVHQPTDLRPEHRTEVDGLPVTTPARTIADLAARLRVPRLGQIVDQAHVDGICPIDEVARIYEELRRPGKPGMGVLGAVLRPRFGKGEPTGSALERRLLSVLRSGIHQPPIVEASFPWLRAGTGRVDVLYLPQRVIVEADGRRWHARMDQMAQDRERDRLCQLHGYDLYRFVWEDITRNPGMVVDTVRQALRLAA